MKKLFVILPVLLGAVNLFALRSGEKAGELTDIRWLKGNPHRLYFSRPEGKQLHYRAVVFLLTHAGNAAGTVDMLHQLREKYPSAIRINVITPDPESDARAFAANIPFQNIAFGVDRDRKTTGRFMGNSMLYPMAFLVGPEGEIVWNGEAVDLPEILEEALKKPLDVEKQKKITALLDELQVLMRDNAERQMRLLADRIFRLDPGNAAAMRMRLFVLENSGRIPEAGQLVFEQLERSPGKVRLYHNAFDLIARYPYFIKDLERVTEAFLQNISDPDACDFAAWNLLSRMSFEPEALKSAVKLYQKGEELGKTHPRSAASLAGHQTAGALLAARLGNLKQAVALQKKAVENYRKSGNAAAAAGAEKTLRYFTLCTQTKVKW